MTAPTISAIGSRSRGGVRWRTTAAATLAVAVFLAVAALAFALVQRHQLEATLTETTRSQAADLARQITGHAVTPELVARPGDQTLVQVVDARGTVVAASSSVQGAPPVVGDRPPPGSSRTIRSAELPVGEGEQFVVVAGGAKSADGPVVVLVAQSLELVDQSTSVVGELLLIGYPIVLLGVALSSYWLAGRALAPVEAIRRRVADIDGTAELDARVPVPDGDDEIARLAVTMNQMLSRLEVASERQHRFVSDASHELRSPLATIRAAHEISALHTDAADAETTHRDVLAELDRLDHLVGDLLSLARADEHDRAVAGSDVDLDHLLEQEARRLRSVGRVQVVLDAPPVRVTGDPRLLSRALRNLVDNAVRHAGSTVTLRVRADDRRAVLEVEDDGPGVPAADRERVFERFVRLDASRARSSGGAGLGLAIAREIARRHGGELTATDGATGARFVLSLPADLQSPAVGDA